MTIITHRVLLHYKPYAAALLLIFIAIRPSELFREERPEIAIVVLTISPRRLVLIRKLWVMVILWFL